MLWVELADTPEKQRSGLMFRKHLSDSSGMMFKFSYPQKLKFWGRNTFIPLDIAFISKDDTITNIEQIPPLSHDCVASTQECVCAIEANVGFFKHNKISIGDRVVFCDNEQEDDKYLVIFKKEE